MKRVALLLVLAACPKHGDKPKAHTGSGSGSAAPPADAAPLVIKPLPAVPFGLPAVPPNPRVTPEEVALGERLFEDQTLSAAGDRSCSTCHDPAHGYAGKVYVAADRKKNMRRTPALVNLAWAPAFGWDGRYKSLADFLPVHSKGQLGTEVTAEQAQALEAFVLTRYEGDSPWDRQERSALAKPNEAPSDPVVAGYRLFMGKAKCGVCHPPPLYTDGDYHAVVDNPLGDPGKAGAFKTPTLRGAASRIAFFHAGSVTTLADAIKHGDGVVTDAEAAQLLAFVEALTSPSR